MPRAKSSAELDAEIQAMRKKLAEKQKQSRAVKRREKALAEQARAYEESEFNRDFVAAAKEIYLSDRADDRRTIYELIRSIIRPPVSPEPLQTREKPEQDTAPVQGAYHQQPGTYTA